MHVAARIRLERSELRGRGAERRVVRAASRPRSTRRSRRSSHSCPTSEVLAPIAGRGEEVRERVRLLSSMTGSGRVIRHHGNFHLGDLLWTGSDWIVLDFEGSPDRSLAERRRKRSPLRDVASMLRSFAYAASATVLTGGAPPPGDWEEQAREHFLAGYFAVVEPSGFVPGGAAGAGQLLADLRAREGRRRAAPRARAPPRVGADPRRRDRAPAGGAVRRVVLARVGAARLRDRAGGRRGQAPAAADARPRQARGAVRRQLPAGRLRALEPRQRRATSRSPC